MHLTGHDAIRAANPLIKSMTKYFSSQHNSELSELLYLRCLAKRNSSSWRTTGDEKWINTAWISLSRHSSHASCIVLDHVLSSTISIVTARIFPS